MTDLYYKLTIIFVVLLAYISMGTTMIGADSQLIMEGRVVNGTPGGQIPLSMEISITELEGGVAIDQHTVVTDPGGFFIFKITQQDRDTTYLLESQYRGAQYKFEFSPNKDESLELTIYESTSDINTLIMLDDTIMITKEPNGFENLSVRQVVRVHNVNYHTFVPTFADSEGAVMNFLRISLPIGFKDLSVRSDLLDGQIIPVERGVGITASIPPGIHAVVLSYKVPYQTSELVFSPLYPLGAEMVRVLIQEDVGGLIGSDLHQQQSVSVAESEFKVYQTEAVEGGDRVTIGLTGLPKTPTVQRIGEVLRNQWDITIIIPSITVLLLIMVLVYVLILRKNRHSWIDSSSLTTTLRTQPDQYSIVKRIASLDRDWQREVNNELEYINLRAELKKALLNKALNEYKTI